jgi:hypothetical protein
MATREVLARECEAAADYFHHTDERRKLLREAAKALAETLPPRVQIAAQLLAQAYHTAGLPKCRHWRGDAIEAHAALTIADALLAAHAETEKP